MKAVIFDFQILHGKLPKRALRVALGARILSQNGLASPARDTYYIVFIVKSLVVFPIAWWSGRLVLSLSGQVVRFVVAELELEGIDMNSYPNEQCPIGCVPPYLYKQINYKFPRI